MLIRMTDPKTRVLWDGKDLIKQQVVDRLLLTDDQRQEFKDHVERVVKSVLEKVHVYYYACVIETYPVEYEMIFRPYGCIVNGIAKDMAYEHPTNEDFFIPYDDDLDEEVLKKEVKETFVI